MIFYQGHLTDSDGSPLDTTINMIFRIYDDSLGTSSSLWGETQYGVVVDNGLFAVSLGSNNAIPDSVFGGTDRGTARWLGVRIGSDPEISPRTRLLSVPYAYRVSTVDGATGGNILGNIVLHSMLTIGELAEEGSAGSLQLTNGSQVVISADGESGQVGIGMVDPNADFHVETTEHLFSGSFSSTFPSASARVVQSEYLGTGAYDATAIYGRSSPQDYYGFGGDFQGGFVGVKALVFPTGSNVYVGSYGAAYGGSGTNFGVNGLAIGSGNDYGTFGEASGTGNNYGVYGRAIDSSGTTNYAVYGLAANGSTNWAGYFVGDVEITGTLYGGQGGFKIDHPLDPQGEYLCHSFVESPDMKNVYDGVVTLDGRGEASVELPKYFDALNRDFRYQLTAIGAPGPDLYIAEKITNNRFKIAGGRAGMEVSWQITGIRKDPFAQAHPMQVEIDKPAKERGTYLRPGAYGLGPEFGVHYQQQREIRESLAKAREKDLRK
jgi:hypothetical protein